MNKTNIILVVFLCAVCFLVGKRTRKCPMIHSFDTVTVYDTIRDTLPYPIYETLLTEINEPFPVYITRYGDTIHDTIYVRLPVMQKEYTTENYKAWISGYNASLDSIDVYPKTMYVTKRLPPKRFGIGLIGGYGVGKQGLSPYIGIGAYYRIW